MNELPSHKRALIKRCLAAGASVRDIARAIPCSTNTVKRYADMWTLSAQCGCGKPAGHSGWCHVRLDFSPVRRGWLHKRWQKRADRELAQTVDAATVKARDLGHDIGRFMWASASAASFAFAICRICGKEVRIYCGDSQWDRYAGWERFAGGAIQIRCRTEADKAADEAAKQERRSWREAKRIVQTLRTHLRAPSSRPTGSAPARTSSA